MKKYLLLFLVLLTFSCKDNTENRENYFFMFKPREAAVVKIIPGEQKISYYEDGKYIVFLTWSPEDETNHDVSQDLLFLEVFTFDSVISPHSMLSLERQIEQSYNNQVNENLRSGNNSKEYLFPVEVEYRINEIKSLTISTLNTPLFGKAAGESLNDFFDIVNYDPPVIVSAPTETLVYGYSSKEYPASIDEWLSLSPLAQATMCLVPNRKIEGLPLDVQFVVQMETADGIVLADTTRRLTITP